MAKEIDKIAVGERIKQIRLEMGYTLEEFGELFNPIASKGVVSKWEKGRNLPNKKRLSDIAFQGQISVDELLHGKRELTIDSMDLFTDGDDIRKYLSVGMNDELIEILSEELMVTEDDVREVLELAKIYIDITDLPEEITITKGE